MEFNQDIVNEYINGALTKDLSEKYNITKSHVRKIVRDAGASRPSGGQVTYDPQIAIDMWGDGHTLDQIALHLKVNRNSVYKQLKKFNVDTTAHDIINRDKLKELIDRGLSDQEISEILKCSTSRLQQIKRKELGVYDETHSAILKRVDELIHYLDSNSSFSEVRSVFNDLDYSTLVRYYDNKYPNQRDNIQRVDLISSLDDPRLNEVTVMLERGESIASILNTHPITNSTLRKMIEVICPDYNPKGYKMLDDDYNKLTNKQWCIDQMNIYNSYTHIAMNLTIGVDVVIKYFKQHEVYPKSTSDLYPLLTNKEWLEDQYKTLSYHQIADKIGVSHPTVRKAMIDLGIEIKRDHLVSKVEKRLLNAIKQIYSGLIIENDRTIIAPKEIDILLPELKLGIEVCGLYWHSEKFKANDYHLDKMNKCNEKGYRLITIFEDELEFEFDKVISKLTNIMNLNSKKVYARKCIVKEIDSSTAENFFKANHIQNYTNASIRLGLFFDDNLVAAMTFKKHVDNVFDLSRFASSINVVGGFSKILSYFKRNYNWSEIFTFADLRWSSRYDNVYVKNKFKEVHVTKPAYFYVDYINKKRIHRMHFQKSNMVNFLSDYDSKLTERQNANKNNYLAIYDCGNAKYTLKVD